ncbi:hypothetical protein F4553_001748 [Allocatelliglobosispora scoriae]|uniref:Uncharacterized protein n=1 Tax=Allocatelliglobosispora scoriae TaxID=643052 RepID=A0A841BMF0_9ACTN|nr:hypothetical protein [Allocatelliglobosispora scoriae]MBB5868369.1 hypothetical protein [Allocatelliglobosispora scoriae]
MTNATRTLLACLVLGFLLLAGGHGIPTAAPATAIPVAAVGDPEPWPHCAGCIP